MSDAPKNASKKQAPSKPARRSRGSLSEEEIVSGAMALVKREGLEGLSMPNLARHLGAGVMSLYWYFHSKDELLGAMAERTMSEVYARLPPLGDGPWDEEVIRLTKAFYTEVRRNPVFAQLGSWRPKFLMSRPSAMPVILKRADEQMQLFQRLGLSASDAIGLFNMLSSYVLGFVLMQLGADRQRREPTAKQALERSVAQLDPEEYPTLRALTDVGALVSLEAADLDDFVELVISGLKSEVGAKQSAGRRTRRAS